MADPLLVAESKLNASMQIIQKRIADAGAPIKAVITQFQSFGAATLSQIPLSVHLSSAFVVLFSSLRAIGKYVPFVTKAFMWLTKEIFVDKTFTILQKISGAFFSQASAMALIAAGAALVEQSLPQIIGLGQAIASTFGMAVVDTEKWAASTQKSVEKVNAAFKKLDIKKQTENLKPATLGEQATGAGKTIAAGLGAGAGAGVLMMAGGIVASIS